MCKPQVFIVKYVFWLEVCLFTVTRYMLHISNDMAVQPVIPLLMTQIL